mgnify:CR=1 FL=1
MIVVLLVLILLVAVGVISAKKLFTCNPHQWVYRTAGLVRLIVKLFYPITFLIMKLSNGLADTKFALAALDMANGHGFRGFFRALSAFVSARLEHRRRRKRLGL